MVLPRIDDQLSFSPDIAQGLIHLFATEQRHVEILVATKKHGWGFDPVGMQKGIRDLDPWLKTTFPGWPDLVIILPDVLVVTIERERESHASPTGGGFEACVASDQVVGENTAVAPAPNSHLVRVGNSKLYDVVDTGVQVDHFLVAPVPGNTDCVLLAASATAPVIYIQDSISGGGEELLLHPESMLILAIGTTVNAQ